jgi:hypothetical protein
MGVSWLWEARRSGAWLSLGDTYPKRVSDRLLKQFGVFCAWQNTPARFEVIGMGREASSRLAG